MSFWTLDHAKENSKNGVTWGFLKSVYRSSTAAVVEMEIDLTQKQSVWLLVKSEAENALLC